MDNSDTVSMSESSTTAATKRKGDKGDKGDKVDKDDAMMKKKLKVLKQAFKEERENKATVEKELERARREIDLLKHQLDEKEVKVKELYKEKMNLEDSLLNDMLK